MPTIFRTAPPNKVECLPISGWVDNLALAAGTAKSYTPPAATNPQDTSRLIRITYSAGALYNSVGQTAAVPTVDVSTGAGSAMVLNGDTATFEAGVAISFINATACVVDLVVIG